MSGTVVGVSSVGLAGSVLNEVALLESSRSEGTGAGSAHKDGVLVCWLALGVLV